MNTTAPNPTEPRLKYSASEVADLLGVSRTTLWRLHKRQLLKPVSGLRRKLYSRQAVESFLNAN
jgi:DNA-binding transcriptional MerR regulator